MSKSKAAPKKPARVAAGPESPGFARSMGETTGRILRPLIPMLAFMLSFSALSYLLWRPVFSESSSVGTRGRLTARTIRNAIVTKPRPVWMSREDFEQVASLGMFAASRNVFEPRLSREIARQYEASPWIESVQSVRLTFPAQMQLEVEWRKPAARVNGSTMVLDHNGYVLNLMSDSPQVVRDIPRISGIAAQRTDAGKQVPEKELLDALSLMGKVREALQAAPGNLKIADIQRVGAMWRILTDRGPLIYWGTYSDDPPEGEPTTQEKVHLLTRRLVDSKDPTSLEFIKIYMPDAPFKPRGVVTADPAIPTAPAAARPAPIPPAPAATRRRARND